MIKSERRIHIISKEKDTALRLGGAFKNLFKDPVSYEIFTSFDSSFYIKIISSPPHLLLIDFSLFSLEETASALTLSSILKTTSLVPRFPIVALIPDEKFLSENPHVASYGLNYLFIKGKETATLIRDSAFLAFEDQVQFPAFAMASKINRNLGVGLCSSIHAINETIIKIETDYLATSNDCQISTDFLPIPQKFTIQENIPLEHNSPFFSKLTLPLPYPGPWDETNEDSLQQDTVLTWLDFLKNVFCPTKMEVLIYTNNLTTISGELIGELSTYCRITNLAGQDKFDWDELLADKFFHMAFVELDPPENALVSQERLAELLQALFKGGKSSTIVIVANSPSTTQAMQKVYGYTNILAIQKSFDYSNMKLMIEKFSKSKQAELFATGFKNFISPHPKNYCNIHFQIKVTSLTEHEITFYSKEDLPLYCLIRLKLPVPCYITIIAPTRELTNSIEGRHYMGIVNGISEEHLAQLRRFVNQIIFKPLENFSEKEVQKLLEFKEEKVQNDMSKEEYALLKLQEKANEAPEQEKVKRLEVNRKATYKGRSKL